MAQLTAGRPRVIRSPRNEVCAGIRRNGLRLVLARGRLDLYWHQYRPGTSLCAILDQRPLRRFSLPFPGYAAIRAPSHTRIRVFRPGNGTAGHPVAVGQSACRSRHPRRTNRRRLMALPDYSMRQLLEAGVHFGHQAHRWNPKMGEYIFGVRNNIHIIDLAQTVPMLHQALQAVSRHRRQGRAHPVRRHQAPGAGRNRGSREEERAILRQFALARRHADQLEDDLRIDLPPAQARGDALLERGAGLHQEGAPRSAARARQARSLARRHQGHGRPARHAVRDRHQQGRHRDQGSAAPEYSGRRDRRHQLRSERDHLRGARQ